MKIITILASLALFFFAFWVLDYEIPFLTDATSYINNSEIATLEARYAPEYIFDTNRKDILGGKENRELLETKTIYYPYLLLNVKYLDKQRTKEGKILWSLVDGEMVLDAETWEKTRGFHDLLQSGATKSDCRLLNALAENRGSMPKEKLEKTLHFEHETLETMIESCRKKQLITISGNEIKLHFENPYFFVMPNTRINEWLVTKPLERAEKANRKFSKNQIEKMSRSAFGSDFSIKETKEVYLPVYRMQVKNPDGSILTTFWNALNGKRITSQ